MWDYTDEQLEELLELARGPRREYPSLAMLEHMIGCLRRSRLRMPTFAQVWPLTAAPLPSQPSSTRILLLAPPWISGEVTAASEPQAEAERLLDERDLLQWMHTHRPKGNVHQTSVYSVVNHPTGNYRVDTFLALVPFKPSLLTAFPEAEAVAKLLAAWEPPPPHEGMERPRVATGHTLTHGLGYSLRELKGGLGHLAERMDLDNGGDAQMAAELQALGFGEELRQLEPILFTQYREVLTVP